MNLSEILGLGVSNRGPSGVCWRCKVQSNELCVGNMGDVYKAFLCTPCINIWFQSCSKGGPFYQTYVRIIVLDSMIQAAIRAGSIGETERLAQERIDVREDMFRMAKEWAPAPEQTYQPIVYDHNQMTS